MIVCYVSKRTDCEMDAGIYEVVLHKRVLHLTFA